jgi:inorganic phosphate transporter, PiT family
MSALLIVILVLVLFAEFVNGWTDAPNAIATVVSTKVLTPLQAVIMAATLNAVGAFSGVAVAKTIGTGIVRPEAINLITVGAAMTGSIMWCLFTYFWAGLPMSKSHAIMAGLAGAGIATAGPSVLIWAGWKKILIGLFFSSVLGFVTALLLMSLIYRIFAKTHPGKIRKYFGKLQILSSAFMAFSHGNNDGQKLIGIFTLSLVLGGVIPEFKVPAWVILLCATIMGIGTATGGWRIIKTMGVRLTKLEPVHGFAVETAAATCIEVASRLGIPLSTTHTVNTAIMGVGATKRLSAVRWGVGKNIVLAWIFTFPISGLISYAVAKILLAIL